MIDKDTSVGSEVQTALQLDLVPNTPYFPHAIATKVKSILAKYSRVKTTEDHLAIYAHYSKGRPKFKLVIDTHLDHPGFVLKDKKTAMALGSIASPDMIKQINGNNPVDVLMFTSKGEFMTKGCLYDFQFKGMQLVSKVMTDASLLNGQQNIQIILELDSEVTSNALLMRSADNLAVTGVALELIKWLSEHEPEADIVFIFAKLEEVRQISATLIANSNGTPFGVFDRHTHIVVLEAATVGQTEATKRISNIPPNYVAGPIIRISDNELVYIVGHQPNLSESLALKAANISGIGVQHTPLISNCNATPYVLFSQCPNIIGLTIPCLNKHNCCENGRFGHEMVLIKDLLSSLTILKNMIYLAQDDIKIHPDRLIDENREYSGNYSPNLKGKREKWLRTALWAEPRSKAEHLFPESVSDLVRFGSAALKARFLRVSEEGAELGEI